LAQANGVILTGMIKGEKLAELYTHANLFVLPSSHEGLPITLLEAMSYELKVLASNIPANLAVALPSDCYFDLNQEKALEVEIDKQLNNQIIQKNTISQNIIGIPSLIKHLMYTDLFARIK
jgi:glycosyltransferase involved in cell wall biosynthesis